MMGQDSFEIAVAQYRSFANPYWIDVLESIGILRPFVSGSGCYLIDDEGNKFLDMVAGFGAVTLGYNHPYLMKAMTKAVGTPAPGVIPWGISPETGVLAQRVCEISGHGLSKVLFGNSGAEAIDGALKFAAARTGRAEFAVCDGAFHGLTVAATALAGGGEWQLPFPPLGPTVHRVAVGDLHAVESILACKRIAAVVIEIVQGTGGGAVWEPDRLLHLSALCKDYGTLLIIDEVLTGLGRTGNWFAFHNAGEDFMPDVVVISKGLTGGMMPISAVLVTDEVFDALCGGPGRAKIHGSTFAGNRLAMSCGLAVIDVLEAEQLPHQARLAGGRLIAGLRNLVNQDAISDIRGSGLVIGVKISDPSGSDDRTAATRCCLGLMSRGVLTNIAAHDPNYLKLTPPLIITDDEIDIFLDALDDSLADSRNGETH
jgi:ornithine--oxo-acid transaminase